MATGNRREDPFGENGSNICKKGAKSYFRAVGVLEAAAWGIAGGAIAGLLSMSAEITLAGFTWPWRDNNDGIWPRLFVFAVLLLVGGGVAAAAHAQVTGSWPALIMGASAPSVIRGAMSKVEVAERNHPRRPARSPSARPRAKQSEVAASELAQSAGGENASA